MIRTFHQPRIYIWAEVVLWILKQMCLYETVIDRSDLVRWGCFCSLDQSEVLFCGPSISFQTDQFYFALDESSRSSFGADTCGAKEKWLKLSQNIRKDEEHFTETQFILDLIFPSELSSPGHPICPLLSQECVSP